MTRWQELLRGGRGADSPRGAVGSGAPLHLVRGAPGPAEARVPTKYARALPHSPRPCAARPGRGLYALTRTRAPRGPAPVCPRASLLSLARAPTLLRPQALRGGAGPQVPAGRPELFIGGKILDVPAARSARGRRAMLSAFRARRAPLLLLTAVLSPKPGQRRGSHFLCHRAISPTLGSPLQSRSLGEPSLPPKAWWNQRSTRGTRAATSGAAWPTPPAAPACVILLGTSRRAGMRVAPAALRLLSRRPGLLGCFELYLAQVPPNEGLCACACPPSFSRFAASRNAGYWE